MKNLTINQDSYKIKNLDSLLIPNDDYKKNFNFLINKEKGFIN